MIKHLVLAFVVGLLVIQTSFAADLFTLYQMAEEKDPQIHAAAQLKYQRHEALPQAHARFLPTINVQAQQSLNHSSNDAIREYTLNGYSINLTQALVNFDNFARVHQAKSRVKKADAAYLAAEQDLMIRVCQQYFNVLTAKDDLHYATTERIAFNRHLDQTKQRYDAGLIAITDVHEAKARYDIATATEIEAQNTLGDEKEKMEEIVGTDIEHYHPLKPDLPLNPPEPTNVKAWEQKGLEYNATLLEKKHDMNVAKREIKRQSSGHLPTLNLTGSHARERQVPPSTGRLSASTIGINLILPLFAGGDTISKTKQAQHAYHQAKDEHERIYRQTISNIRQAYRGVNTQINQVLALKQAVFSNKSALNATQEGFKAGTRTIVDVLNAQSNLTRAQRNLARARYDYIMEGLRLKRNAGIITPNDLLEVNAWIEGAQHLPGAKHP